MVEAFNYLGLEKSTISLTGIETMFQFIETDLFVYSK